MTGCVDDAYRESLSPSQNHFLTIGRAPRRRGFPRSSRRSAVKRWAQTGTPSRCRTFLDTAHMIGVVMGQPDGA